MGVTRPDLRAIGDRLAIEEVLHRYCRGIDRMDKALTLSCWHPGGTDSHAPLYAGPAEGFIDWLWPVHGAMLSTRHVVTNTLIVLDGDRAASECYWSIVLRIPQQGQVYDLTAGGRYIDRFECIDDVWAIRHRQSVRDWSRVDPAEVRGASQLQPLIAPNNPEVAETLSRRDVEDYSYGLLGRMERLPA